MTIPSDATRVHTVTGRASQMCYGHIYYHDNRWRYHNETSAAVHTHAFPVGDGLDDVQEWINSLHGTDLEYTPVAPPSVFETVVQPAPATTVVMLTAKGVDRVLNGAVGMTFLVDRFTDGVQGPVAHVRDYRYPGEHKPYQIWSIAADGYLPVASLPQGVVTISAQDFRDRRIIGR